MLFAPGSWRMWTLAVPAATPFQSMLFGIDGRGIGIPVCDHLVARGLQVGDAALDHHRRDLAQRDLVEDVPIGVEGHVVDRSGKQGVGDVVLPTTTFMLSTAFPSSSIDNCALAASTTTARPAAGIKRSR